MLESSEVGIPLPGRGDVLVQVGAASVHPGDCFIMTGEPYAVRLVLGLRRYVAAGHTRGKVVITV